MALLIKLFIFLVFWPTSYFAEIVVTTESDKSKLVEAAIEIVGSCYEDRSTTVGVAGSSTEMISKALWSRASFQIALIDGTSRTVNKHPDGPQNLYKLLVFVVAASSPSILVKTLNDIKASIWWNHKASFLILDWPPSNPGCSNAFEMLWTAWEKNLLNAKFLCYRRIENRLIYTFNPYTNRAPTPWRLEKTYAGRNGHPWTLFVRGYEESRGACNEMDFEKANDLGGYKIAVSALDDFYGKDNIKCDSTVCLSLYDDIIIKTLFPALNATPKMLVHSSVNSLGFINNKGSVNGILEEIANGSSEFSSSVRFVTSMGNLTVAYPFWLSGLYALTQHSGYKSQLSKISSVVDRNSQFGLYLVCFLTVLYFKYFVHQSVIASYLSTLHIICNSSLPKIPKKLAPRIYLGSLFLFALTIQGIYQGRLASLLTKQQPLRDVNTKTDLAELGHTIYGSTTYRLYFDDPEFDGRYVSTEGWRCTEYVLRDPRAACVAGPSLLIHDAVKLKLHLSREPLVSIYMTIPIQLDWPLEKRANELFMRLMQAHHIQYLYDNVTYRVFRRLQLQLKESNDESAKVLTLEQLSFAFVILGIGLGCATISFIIEVAFERVHPRIV